MSSSRSLSQWKDNYSSYLVDRNLGFASYPFWIVLFSLLTAILIASLWFLWPAPLEFPLDDTYIHFVYAQNLAENGSWKFNFAGERGVGTTSPLWVLLLAAGHSVGVSIHLLAKILGIVSLLITGLGLYLLLNPILLFIGSLSATLLVVLSGNMLWFTLSGMETMMFLALGVLALLVYRSERWVCLGVVLGLLILTRPEGVALAIAIGCVEVWRWRGIQSGIIISGVVCALICGPWYAYLLWRTGYILPTSAIAKRDSFLIGIHSIGERNKLLAVLSYFPPLIYLGLMVSYLLEFVLGGVALPPPYLSIGSFIGIPYYTVSLWAVIGWAAVILPLIVSAIRRIGPVWYLTDWIQDSNRRPLIAFIVWVVLHNLIYSVFMPSIGTASRYAALNLIGLWLVLTIGFLRFVNRPRLLLWLAGGLTVIVLANTMYWNKVYDANLEFMQDVRIPAAHFVGDNFSQDEMCAAFDIGALRFFSRRPIVDLGGLVDPNVVQWYLDGAFDRYLLQSGASCLVLPGRVGASENVYYDFVDLMGFSNTDLFDIIKVTSFELNRERWLQGNLATNNYPDAVTIYRLDTPYSTDE